MCDTAHNFVIHLHWVCEVLASHYWTCVHMKTTCRQTMWRVVWHSWQLCDRFTSSLPGLRISLLNMCSHEDHMHRNCQWEWAFIYHMLLYPRKLQVYHTYVETVALFFWIPYRPTY
jgi:hypothetical protein